MNNSNNILLWNHLSLTKKVKYCLGTSHHLLSPLTIFLRCLLVFLFAIYVEFQTKVPLDYSTRCPAIRKFERLQAECSQGGAPFRFVLS